MHSECSMSRYQVQLRRGVNLLKQQNVKCIFWKSTVVGKPLKVLRAGPHGCHAGSPSFDPDSVSRSTWLLLSAKSFQNSRVCCIVCRAQRHTAYAANTPILLATPKGSQLRKSRV